MKHKKIFLSTEFPSEKTAKTKAKVDVMEILESEGYHSVYFPKVNTFMQIVRFWRSLSKIIDKNSHLVLEYPCMPRKRIWVITTFKFLKGIKLFGIIHDIGDLRFPNQKQLSDMLFLNKFDGLISHNASMTQWLKDKGFNKPVVNLEVFDYCLKDERNFNESDVSGKLKLLYAGNLAYNKATYLYDKKLDKLESFCLCVYGQYFEKERMNGSRVNYKGVFNPDAPDLPEKYHFGLIWEGESIDTCTGQYGQYIRYNNPHKFSLYLSLGLPVIVWKEAAIASFVSENKIGFTIASFDELEQRGETVSEIEYREYLSNIDQLSKKVKKGFFLGKAINQLVNKQHA
ncbi:MAG TPA: hypothetical protein VM101_00895 [Flavitalea sp.]|nr:hypothetical protein [Flavitalea sp.]